MPDIYVNRRKQAVASAPGTGTVTLGAAVPSFLPLGVIHNGLTFSVLFRDGLAWEIATGCTYTHAGTTLTRGTLEESSSGSRINLSASTTVSVILPASTAIAWDSGIVPSMAITDRATTPTPVFGQILAWSTTALRPAFWDGARWNLLERPPTPVSLTTNITLAAADSNTTYDTGSTSRAITVPLNLPTHFAGVTVRGPSTWAFAGGVTFNDRRATGAGYAHATLVPFAANSYELVGTSS